MNILCIARRDFKAYTHGYAAYVIIASVLFLQGLFFNAWVLRPSSARYSHEVLEDFFYLDGGFVIAAAILLTMRALAGERATGTDVLLNTSTMSPGHIVVGKWLAAMGMLGLLTLLTGYMPALIFVNGKVAIAHILVGYLGVLCGSRYPRIVAGAAGALAVFTLWTWPRTWHIGTLEEYLAGTAPTLGADFLAFGAPWFLWSGIVLAFCVFQLERHRRGIGAS